MKKVINSEKVLKRSVSYEPIDEVYCKYFDYVETFVDGRLEEGSNHVGVATIEELESIKEFEPITCKINVDWMCEGYGYIVGIDKEEYDKLLCGKVHIGNIGNNWGFNVPYDPDRYVYCIYNHGAWHLADLKKNPIRYPIYFDYCGGRVTDANYDLPKVLDFMKGDSRFMTGQFIREDELSIIDIPYYNADEYTGYHAIQFYYMPATVEEMKEMMISHSYEKSLLLEKLLEPFKISKNCHE